MDAETHNFLAHPEVSLQLCTVCSKVFCSRDDLLIHMRSHPKPPKMKKGRNSDVDTPSEYKCDVDMCGKSYPTNQQLKSHIKVHRHEPYSLDCKICHKVFKSAHYARQHIKVHTGERPFRCHLCRSVPLN